MAPSLSSLLLAAILPLVSGLPDPSPASVEIANANSTTKMDNSWIVVWKPEADDKTIAARQSEFAATLRKRSIGKRDVDGNPMPMESINYAIGSLRATACNADAKTMNLMISNAVDEVDYVEANQFIQMFQTENVTEAPPPTSDATANVTVNATAVGDGGGPEAFRGQGAGTVIYILDTGVNVKHKAFEGRATMTKNLVPNESEEDLNGHGTHCAGSAAGIKVGVAPKAQIKGIKILNAKGSGSADSIIGGIDAACSDVKQNKLQGKCVVSMSLGTGPSRAINNAAEQMSKCGCAVVAAAGNEGKDASTVSPASSDGVITVGATDARTNQLASFSNTGPEVDISANGVNVISADAKNIFGTKELSGTSMSAPQIGGKALEVLGSGQVKCNTDCTEVVKGVLQDEAKKEKPITDKKGDTDTTPLQIDTSNEVPVDPKGPTPVSAGGQKGKGSGGKGGGASGQEETAA